MTRTIQLIFFVLLVTDIITDVVIAVIFWRRSVPTPSIELATALKRERQFTDELHAKVGDLENSLLLREQYIERLKEAREKSNRKEGGTS